MSDLLKTTTSILLWACNEFYHLNIIACINVANVSINWNEASESNSVRSKGQKINSLSMIQLYEI